MRDLRRVTEDEVIHAFLHEVESERWREVTTSALVNAGGSIRLVTHPNLADPKENQVRRAALAAARGWGQNTRMFQGFPADVEWWHADLAPDEVERIRYIDYSYWNELSGGSRRVVDVERTIRGGGLPDWLAQMGTDWCFDLAEAYRNGLQTPDIILLTTPEFDRFTVVEGHARITGLVLSGVHRQRPIPAFVGVSPASDWMP